MKTLPLILAALLAAPLHAAPVKVAVAANVQYAFAEVAQAFTRDTGVAVQSSFNSSGKFATQILNGAPFEVFLSADTEFPQKLQQAGATQGGPRVYARGELVLWTLDAGLNLSNWPAALAQAQGKLAVANPQTAPYGQEAMRALAHYRIADTVKPRLVYGESIAQTNQYIESGVAQAGFTAKSVVLAPQMQGKGRWVEVSGEAYQPIDQAAVLLKPAAANPDARRFHDYLYGPAARAIFKKYGYSLP